ncbi:MAG: alpha/beta hydrolase [Verrucomicrobiota bacterium]
MAKSFTTSDNVRLHYTDVGEGDPLFFLPGWSQTAAMFRFQLEEFSNTHRCLALDWRGHGESDKPNGGYRHSRLAMDLKEWLDDLNVESATLIGHSMGAKVIWNFWELFQSHRISRLVTIDQTPRILNDPSWTEQERLNYGGHMEFASLEALCHRLASPEGVDATREFLPNLFTRRVSQDILEWVIEENLKMPRRHAAFLLRETALSDSRDILSTINIPTLVMAGEASYPRSQEWIHEQFPSSSFCLIPASEGGSHFCFLENPDLFNQGLRTFLNDSL